MKPLFILLSALFLLSGCGSSTITSIGVYGDKPIAQNIKGSYSQGMTSRVVEFTSEECFEATKTALLRKGYNVDSKDMQKGLITASGHLKCENARFTVAIYIQQLNNSPESKITIIADKHDLIACQMWFSQGFPAAIATETLQVLSTY